MFPALLARPGKLSFKVATPILLWVRIVTLGGLLGREFMSGKLGFIPPTKPKGVGVASCRS